MVKIQDLKVSYGENQVLKGINLECVPGEIHGILGFNGAGKTTLFRTMYGFKKRDDGLCHYQGKTLRSRDVVMMETDTFFYAYMKGKEYLELLAIDNERFIAAEWNAFFDLPLDDLIDTYSTGMKKKLAFLGVIALDRPIWILDEPFSGVDVESNEKIFQILQRIKTTDKIILISSHILASFTTVSDKISVLKEGRMIRTYSKTEFPILEKELREEIQLGMEGALDSLLGKKKT